MVPRIPTQEYSAEGEPEPINVRELRGKLRKELLVKRFPVPKEGEELKPAIIEKLKAEGIYRPGLKMRVISKDRLPHAIRKGTDRDSESMVEDGRFGFDDEKTAMKERGLDPDRDIGQTIYVANLDGEELSEMKAEKNRAVLIYAPEALTSLEPVEKNSRISFGFHMFIDRGLIQKSLLAVFS